MQDSRKDFFISHHKTDQIWAEWIAWQLEQANYSIMLPSRDIQPGNDFVNGKQKAFEVSERIMGVFSPDYLNDPETKGEWAAALRDQKLLPVRVRECNPLGLLGTILYIDLVRLEEREAREKLLSGVIRGRVSPTKAPLYPGPPPIWNIPNVNRYFKGREEDLIQLHNAFTTYWEEAVPLQIVSGLGGIGKTQLVVRYAHVHRNNKYRTGLWVNAYINKTETLRSDFIALAKLLDLQEKDKQNQDTVDAVIRWLEDENHSDWLLIFDNVKTPDMVDGYIPSKGKGHILLTTRTQIMGMPYKHTEIDKLKPDEGASFLLNRAGISPSANGDFSPKDKEIAKEISRLMDGHPLALDQAGAFVQETNCGLERYLVIYREREQRTKLLNRRGKFPFEHPDPVATTLVLSFESVKQTGQVGQVAYHLLQLCAFLHPDAIPEEIISKGAPTLGNDWEEAIAILREFSLIRRNPDTGMLSIHRLVQTVLRDQMDTATRRLWAEQAVRSVHQVFPESKSVTWQDCQKYFPHVQACAAHIDEWSMSFTEAGELLYRMGCYLQEHSQDVYSTPIFIDGLSIWEKTQKGELPAIAIVLENYAAQLRKMNSDAEAACLEAFARTIRDNYT